MKLILAVLLMLTSAVGADGGWKHSYTYKPGYTYYGACYVNNVYYPPSYWYYEETPQIVIATFQNTQYVPVSFATYQPASVSPYQTQPLSAVAQLQAVPPPTTGAGVAAVTTTGATVQTGVVQQGATVQPTSTDGLALQAILKKLDAMDQRLVAVERGKGPTPGPVPSPMPKADDATPPVKRSALATRCAVCHSAATASTKLPDGSLKGGGLIYFTGEGADARPAFSARQINAAVFQVLKGKMPKIPPGAAKLEDSEGQALLAELESLVPVPDKKE